MPIANSSLMANDLYLGFIGYNRWGLEVLEYFSFGLPDLCGLSDYD